MVSLDIVSLTVVKLISNVSKDFLYSLPNYNTDGHFVLFPKFLY